LIVFIENIKKSENRLRLLTLFNFWPAQSFTITQKTVIDYDLRL